MYHCICDSHTFTEVRDQVLTVCPHIRLVHLPPCRRAPHRHTAPTVGPPPRCLAVAYMYGMDTVAVNPVAVSAALAGTTITVKLGGLGPGGVTLKENKLDSKHSELMGCGTPRRSQARLRTRLQSAPPLPAQRLFATSGTPLRARHTKGSHRFHTTARSI